MNKRVWILMALVAAVVVGWYFSQGNTVIETNQAEELSASPVFVDDAKTQQKSLFDLKNSIENVIDDSVQDDVQQAIEDKLRKNQ